MRYNLTCHMKKEADPIYQTCDYNFLKGGGIYFFIVFSETRNKCSIWKAYRGVTTQHILIVPPILSKVDNQI